MKPASVHIAVYPRCGCTYQGLPAPSRVDNEPLICADWGDTGSVDNVGNERSTPYFGDSDCLNDSPQLNDRTVRFGIFPA